MSKSQAHHCVVIFSDEPGWHGKQLKRAFEKRGLDTSFVSLAACSLKLDTAGSLGMNCAKEYLSIPGVNLDRLRGAFVRGVPGGTLESVILRLNVLHALELLNIPVFNSGRAIERTVDKSMTSFLLRQHGVPTIATWVTASKNEARDIAQNCIADRGWVVVKPLFGSQGDGVERISSLKIFDTFKPANGVYYLQSYIKPTDGKYCDWRVFVVNQRAVAAMQRTSHHWVTNRARGATCKRVQAEQALFDLAEQAASALQVDYAGVDLMRDEEGRWVVGEVNGIPAWQGLQRTAEVDIASLLVEAHLAKMEANERAFASA